MLIIDLWEYISPAARTLNTVVLKPHNYILVHTKLLAGNRALCQFVWYLVMPHLRAGSRAYIMPPEFSQTKNLSTRLHNLDFCVYVWERWCMVHSTIIISRSFWNGGDEVNIFMVTRNNGNKWKQTKKNKFLYSGVVVCLSPLANLTRLAIRTFI